MIAKLDQGGLGMPDRDYYLASDDKTVHVRAAYLAHVQRVFELLGDPHPVAQMKPPRSSPSRRTSRRRAATGRSPRSGESLPQDDPRRRRPGRARLRVGRLLEGARRPRRRGHQSRRPLVLHGDVRAARVGPDRRDRAFRPYLRWQVARGFAELLPKRFVDESFAFEKEMTGAPKILPRWKRCVQRRRPRDGRGARHPVRRGQAGAEGKEVTQGMVRRIELAMQADVDTLAWMDKPTRTHALEKLPSCSTRSATRRSGATTTRSPPRSQRGLRRQRRRGGALRAAPRARPGGQAGRPRRVAGHDAAPTVNAYYNPSLNEMVFPAGILQPPFFEGRPPRGQLRRDRDGHGARADPRLRRPGAAVRRRRQPEGLVDCRRGAEFEKRAACVVDQFDGYTAVDDLHVNGRLTLGENIADLGGAKLALSVVRSIGTSSGRG